MAGSHTLGGINSADALNQKASRIENDIEHLKNLTARVHSLTHRTMHHLHTLGYSVPKEPSPDNTIAPVTMTLVDAIQDLDRAIDHLGGTLTAFD